MAEQTERVCVAFGTGEVSPINASRSDVEKFSTACRSLQNMTLGVYGYAERRSGTQFVARTKASEPGSSGA